MIVGSARPEVTRGARRGASVSGDGPRRRVEEGREGRTRGREDVREGPPAPEIIPKAPTARAVGRTGGR